MADMVTDGQTIKNYDNYAEKWAKHMRSGKNLMHEYLEKPAMYDLLGDLTGKTVLCVGCGSGEECEALRRRGAARVVGIDISAGLIEEAKKAFSDVEFSVMDMEELKFANGSFDLIYSSLVMHYVPSWTKVLAEARRVLKSGGRLLFSTHHPTMWGSEIFRDGDIKRKVLGSESSKKNKSVRIFGDYFGERWIDDVWFGDFSVRFYHRPLESLIGDIFGSGLVLKGFYEPRPVKELEKIDRLSYGKHQKIPTFIIFDLQRGE
jgi:ubiquinone/menaquinone biosynthesis C-methylase UbiE